MVLVGPAFEAFKLLARWEFGWIGLEAPDLVLEMGLAKLELVKPAIDFFQPGIDRIEALVALCKHLNHTLQDGLCRLV